MEVEIDGKTGVVGCGFGAVEARGDGLLVARGYGDVVVQDLVEEACGFVLGGRFEL